MKQLSLIFAAILLSLSAMQPSYSAEGIVTGGVIYELPAWFKPSFLNFEEEIDEAKAQGKHLMAFMHLDECPYCHRMLKENFVESDAVPFIQANFEVIGINVRGDLDVTWIDGGTYTERELTRHLKTIATPTIVFLDLEGNKVLQLNGYRDPRSFRYALDYVHAKQYLKESFPDYLSRLEKPDIYDFRTHPRFEQVTNFKGYRQPLMILFEDRQCGECERFHDNTLNHPNVLAAMEGYLVVRLDTDSSQTMIDPEGRVNTPQQWARDLNLTFRPAIVLFNEGEERFRADGAQYQQHLSEALLYAKTGYLEYSTIREFKQAYREALLKSGRNVDFSE